MTFRRRFEDWSEISASLAPDRPTVHEDDALSQYEGVEVARGQGSEAHTLSISFLILFINKSTVQNNASTGTWYSKAGQKTSAGGGATCTNRGSAPCGADFQIGVLAKREAITPTWKWTPQFSSTPDALFSNFASGWVERLRQRNQRLVEGSRDNAEPGQVDDQENDHGHQLDLTKSNECHVRTLSLPWGSSKPMIGPAGTTPVGLIEG
jgi:hypothetical protein